MIVLDNSEYMRNGDYIPTRFEAQIKAALRIFSSKTRSNPESMVGLMTMAGDVKVTFINDIAHFQQGTREAGIGGSIRLAESIQVAALALKHRQNKNLRQRIIVFVGSPIHADAKELVRLARRMKKNNIAIDFVSFGQEGDNSAILQQFIDAVNTDDNSHLVTIPPGPHHLSDMVLQSPILNDGTGAGGNNFMNEYMDDSLGFDAEADPELAMALRMSLEEERQRQERAAREAQAQAAAAAAEGNGSGEQGDDAPGREANDAADSHQNES